MKHGANASIAQIVDRSILLPFPNYDGEESYNASFVSFCVLSSVFMVDSLSVREGNGWTYYGQCIQL